MGAGGWDFLAEGAVHEASQQAADWEYMCISTGIRANIVNICANPRADDLSLGGWPLQKGIHKEVKPEANCSSSYCVKLLRNQLHVIC